MRFEDFWVIIKAIAFRLAKKVQAQSDSNVTGDKLLWKLVKVHHRSQFALPKVKMQPKLDFKISSPWDTFEIPDHN